MTDALAVESCVTKITICPKDDRLTNWEQANACTKSRTLLLPSAHILINHDALTKGASWEGIPTQKQRMYLMKAGAWKSGLTRREAQNEIFRIRGVKRRYNLIRFFSRKNGKR